MAEPNQNVFFNAPNDPGGGAGEPPGEQKPLINDAPMDPGPGPRFDETLLAPSLIRLFGREFKGLALVPQSTEDARAMPYFPNQLAELLTAGPNIDEKRRARLARIYGFSYEGLYYKLG